MRFRDVGWVMIVVHRSNVTSTIVLACGSATLLGWIPWRVVAAEPGLIVGSGCSAWNGHRSCWMFSRLLRMWEVVVFASVLGLGLGLVKCWDPLLCRMTLPWVRMGRPVRVCWPGIVVERAGLLPSLQWSSSSLPKLLHLVWDLQRVCRAL